jgi:large subunit ribosomal protein L29
MRASDLRDLSDTELDEHIMTARRELFGLRSQHAVNRALDNTASLGGARRELARALTIARERTLESGQENG